MSTGVGIGPTKLVARLLNWVGTPVTGEPPATMFASPRPTYNVPSVAITGLICMTRGLLVALANHVRSDERERLRGTASRCDPCWATSVTLPLHALREAALPRTSPRLRTSRSVRRGT